MSIAYAESCQNSPNSPFTDGEYLRYFDRETGWQVKADQDGFLFMCTKPEDFRYFSANRQEVKWLLTMCPASVALFDAGYSPEGYQTFRIPTLERANAFAAEKFEGLPTAGIQAWQEDDMGNTCAPGYLGDLTRGEVPHLPVARGHERHFHDLIGHFLGAATVDEVSFAAFREIGNDARSLWAQGPQWPPILYVESVAKGFDQFTDNQIRHAMHASVPRDGYLLGQTLQWISMMRRQYLPRAVEIVRNFGMEVRQGRGYYPVVPWEMEYLPTYYEQIAERLR